MDKEEVKNRMDFNNIQVFEYELVEGVKDTIVKEDYLVDFEGNFIYPLSILDVKLIEKIKELEARITELELKEVSKA